MRLDGALGKAHEAQDVLARASNHAESWQGAQRDFFEAERLRPMLKMSERLQAAISKAQSTLDQAERLLK